MVSLFNAARVCDATASVSKMMTTNSASINRKLRKGEESIEYSYVGGSQNQHALIRLIPATMAYVGEMLKASILANAVN